jgi:protein-L-isoaspartate(D-aspartate) O-methyltransferase
MLTAVGEQVPPRLVDQLAAGGRMVLPLGPQFGPQMLVVVEKAGDGSLITQEILPVQFVPLTGAHRGDLRP